MKRFLTLLVLVVLVVAFSTQAWAAAGADASHMSSGFYFQVANFFILLTILVIVARKPLAAFFQSRSENTETTLEEAKKVYDKAYRKFEEIEAKLNNADVEGKKLLEDLKSEGEAEKQRILEKAKETASQIKSAAEKTVDQEVIRAKERLRQETANLALELAQADLEKLLTADKQKEIGNEFVNEVKTMKVVS